MKNNKFALFLLKCSIYTIIVLGAMVAVNYFIDASSAITPRHTEMAKLALEGNVVALPQNYNERAYQICIVEGMTKLPETVVIGSSRGMFLGEEIIGVDNIYNNCVSGACIEDNYALLGLYQKKFGDLPSRVILETGPWVFYEENPEARWKEVGEYQKSAQELYQIINGKELHSDVKNENPYLSISYFQYNLQQLMQNGVKILDKKEEARIRENEEEPADHPDGTIIYGSKVEEESEERLSGVRNTSGACTYENVHLMTEVSEEKCADFEALIDYLLECGTEVIIYLQPFSETQCKYSFDQGLNVGFRLAEDYLTELALRKGISLVGSYDARKFGLTDERFMDATHLDRVGTHIVWNAK